MPIALLARIATKKIILPYPSGASQSDAAGRKRGTYAEVYVPCELFDLPNGNRISASMGCTVAANMWNAYITGTGVKMWPPTREEFLQASGFSALVGDDKWRTACARSKLPCGDTISDCA
jgi:hypothetical protein